MNLLISSLNNASGILMICWLSLAVLTGLGSVADAKPGAGKPLRVAVMPVENLSGTTAPLDEIRASLIRNLKRRGLDVLDDDTLERFRERHRVRYTAGLDAATSKALKEEAGVDAVLITLVDLYSEQSPPRISLLSRLVATGHAPAILWFDSAGLSGDDSPGLLGLTRIDDPVRLREKALDRLFSTLDRILAGGTAAREGERRSFRPKNVFRSSVVGTDLRELFIDFVQDHSEGDESAGPARLGVVLSSSSGRTVTVEYGVRSGTAVSGRDYKLPGTVLTFRPGETFKTIELDIRDNRLNEGNRVVGVVLKNPRNALLGKTALHAYTIVDDDPEPAVAFTRGNRRVGKAGQATITAELSEVSGRDVIVPFVATGTAKTPADYTITPGPLVIKAGTRRASLVLSVAGPGISGNDKTVVVNMGSPTNAKQGKTITSVVTIAGADPANAAEMPEQPVFVDGPAPAVVVPDSGSPPVPLAAFAVKEQRVRRSMKSATITVELSATSGRDVIVPFTVSGAALSSGAVRVTESPIVIKAGRRAAAVLVTMEGNGSGNDEALEVALADPANAALGQFRLHRLVIAGRDPRPTIAVVPFVNASSKKFAGEIMMLQFVKELTRLEQFTVIEPGIVRQTLLAMRIIMYDGASLPDIDLILSSLDADLILSGTVFEYQDHIASGGTPKADFSVTLFEKTRRKVIWASKSYNQGDDGVTLFDWGNITTANVMVTEMARSVRNRLVAW